MPPDLSPLPFASFAEFARSMAELDVELGGEPRHRIVGYRGEEPLLLLDLRPFPPGGIHAPLVEAVAGLLPLGVDRLAAALPSRAWSTDDPIAPVSGDVDLRQRVLLLTTARRDATPRTWLQPFELDVHGLTWQDEVLGADRTEGWVPHALQVAADAVWPIDVEAAVRQLARCGRLGHDVLLAPAGADLLSVNPAAGSA